MPDIKRTMVFMVIIVSLIFLSGCVNQLDIKKVLEDNVENIEIGNCFLNNNQNITIEYIQNNEQLSVIAFDDRKIATCTIRVNLK